MKRELTALVAAPLAIWIIGWAHPYVFDAAIALIAALALYEFLDLGKQKGYHIPIALCIAVMLFIIAAFILEPISVEMGVFLALLLIPGSYVFSRGNLEEALPSSAIAVLATLYVGMLGGSLIRLHNDFRRRPEAGLLPAARGLARRRRRVLLRPHVRKAQALAAHQPEEDGRGTDRRRRRRRSSPRSSSTSPSSPTSRCVHAIIAGVILSVAGVIGDLAESMWKRSAAVKDSGTLIPGHGGFLDRFDSIFFTAPILYVYWFLIVHDSELQDHVRVKSVMASEIRRLLGDCR